MPHQLERTLRNARIVKMSQEGHSIREIVSDVGLTRIQVGNILRDHQKHKPRPEPPEQLSLF